VAPDLRGYGLSPLDSAPFSHAGDVVRLLDHLGIDRCAVVGSSGGGAVALQVASAVPDRVSALVLLCAAADGVEPTADLRAFSERESALLHAGDVAGATELNVDMWLQPEVEASTRELFREMQSNAFRVQLAAGDDVDEEDAEIDLATISCPATVVTGGRDLAWFRAVGDHLAAELRRAERIELSWAGHLPNLERPNETTELIRRSIQT
jgi:3-oxoadipate enol-lactonase